MNQNYEIDKTFTYLFHISDIHIQNNVDRQNEFKLQFNKLFTHFLLNIFIFNASDLTSFVRNRIEILILSLWLVFSVYLSVIIIPPL